MHWFISVISVFTYIANLKTPSNVTLCLNIVTPHPPLSSANLPPTLAKSQVSSVRKNLKIHLVAVLKHPCSLDFQAQIGTLLLDLGMPQSEISRATPVPREPRKRPRTEQYTEGKKIKMGEWSDDGRGWGSRMGSRGEGGRERVICRFAYVQIFSAFIVSKAAEQSLVERVRK